ncbi:lysophospholipid acyltransferase family protein [Asaia prunellae]|uniref:lysophospholipid acyltransferase family protein n=1 Tax=Asaia prunellae TaxID=610245 RepID=UPI0009FE8D90|nr:lysophospholipid acyltransferase family protein [Asaia prunellae]
MSADLFRNRLSGLLSRWSHSPDNAITGGKNRPVLEDFADLSPTGKIIGKLEALHACLRLAGVVVWVPLSVGFEALLLPIPGVLKIRWTRVIWGVLCRLLDLDIKMIGQPVGTVGGKKGRARGERPIIYVANHSSWLDIPVLGTKIYSVFVAKGDIERWPIMGLVSKIGRTIFVSRNRSTTGRERDEMITRLATGDNLILFPEGTSSDGSRVLPFMSTFFAIAKLPRLPKNAPALDMPSYPAGLTPLIQPISLVYDRLEGLPVTRTNRAVFAWYGDMDLGPHVWQFLKRRNKRATILMHPPLAPEDFPSRKALANAAWSAVAYGAAALRQNSDTVSGWQPLDSRATADAQNTGAECPAQKSISVVA